MPWTGLRQLLDEWRHARHRSELWRISRRLNTSSLRDDDSEELVPEDFLRPESRASRLFLGYYSASGIEYGLREYGVWGQIAANAGCPPRVELHDTGERLQRIRIVDEQDRVHAEIRAALEWRRGGQWLYVDWILSQNPAATFAPDRPRLPDQEHPGAGIGRDLMEIVLIMGHRLRCEGVAGRPAHFHNAVLYRMHFRFEDPALEGRCLAAMRAMERAEIGLAEASWAVERGRLKRRWDDLPVAWCPKAMLAPLVPSAEFQTDAWQQAVEHTRRADPLYFDLDDNDES